MTSDLSAEKLAFQRSSRTWFFFSFLFCSFSFLFSAGRRRSNEGALSSLGVSFSVSLFLSPSLFLSFSLLLVPFSFSRRHLESAGPDLFEHGALALQPLSFICCV